MTKKQSSLVWAVVIGSMAIGGILSMYILEGERNYEIAIAVIIGSIAAFFIQLFYSKWRQKKNGNVPEFDERSLLLMRRYFMVVLYVLFGSGALLMVLYAVGVREVEIEMIVLYMMALFMVIGFGALVAKRM